MSRLPISTDSNSQAMATVTACTYSLGVGRALAFGVPTSQHFVITYNYFAQGALHTGQFTSRKAIPQGTLFPVTYDPAVPHRHGRATVRTSRRQILAAGLVGSIVLSLAWLAILHGCS